MAEKNEVIQIEITDLTEEGYGVGRHGGMAVFVPNAIPGDTAEVKLIKIAKNYAVGRLEKLTAPSKDRIQSDCPVFGRCGGCSLRNMTYEAELRYKQNKVLQNLIRLGGFDPDKFVFESIISKNPNRYRNKAQFPVCKTGGKVAAGLFSKHSHTVVPVDDCLLQPENFSRITAEICAFCAKNGIEPYDETAKKGYLRHIYLRGTADGGVGVCLVVNGNFLQNSRALVAKLTGKFPQVKSVCLNINKADTNVILGKETQTLWGEPALTDTLCGLEFDVSPQSFYQVNREAAQALYQKAAEYAGLTGEETVLDLYCGTGTIGLSMAKDAAKVIGIEIVPEAVENARRNAEKNHITNAEFFLADVDNFGDTDTDSMKSMDVVKAGDADTNAIKETETVKIGDADTDAMNGAEVVNTGGGDADSINTVRAIKSAHGNDDSMFAGVDLKPDVVITDPPRKGCGKATLETICRFASKRIVMVSCDSATLARDLKFLSENGYTLQKAVPVDMFPRTMHVECVVLMSK